MEEEESVSDSVIAGGGSAAGSWTGWSLGAPGTGLAGTTEGSSAGEGSTGSSGMGAHDSPGTPERRTWLGLGHWPRSRPGQALQLAQVRGLWSCDEGNGWHQDS